MYYGSAGYTLVSLMALIGLIRMHYVPASPRHTHTILYIMYLVLYTYKVYIMLPTIAIQTISTLTRTIKVKRPTAACS